jgi:membrane-bound lytic murein transglycosylase MltF
MDWLLLAAIAYQESNFYPDQISRMGASGLMGLMPKTAQQFGLSPDSLDHPESNIRTAAEVLRMLNRTFADTPEENDQRLQLVLASYNAGAGNIQDEDYIRPEETINYVQDVIGRWLTYQEKINGVQVVDTVINALPLK